MEVNSKIAEWAQDQKSASADIIRNIMNISELVAKTVLVQVKFLKPVLM
ncbi:MAG: hypothetical protein MJK10_18825 [Pseudomonadales bacterium]|nr:hypothetical protein [Pseudomonadales bacterium]NRA16395.1 hypothetical protein [Oceanospirillaceae bacterium]